MQPCTGITNFSPLRHQHAQSGIVVSPDPYPSRYPERFMATLYAACQSYSATISGGKSPQSFFARSIALQNGIVAPMLRRIGRVRDTAGRATNGQLDILDRPEHSDLRKAIDALRPWPTID